MNKYRMHILVCGGTNCHGAKSKEVVREFNLELKKNGLLNEVQVVTTGCFGLCGQGPIVRIYPDNTLYVRVTVDDIEEIVSKHVIKGDLVQRLLRTKPLDSAEQGDSKPQGNYMRIALRNCGVIDPDEISEYIKMDGYSALAKALESMSRQEVIDEIKKSGLRGRGGAGFPTGLKWESAYSAESDKKYIVCNADEGDPGAFMDRSILEGDPHSVLEAMAIAGYAIGADEGIIYIRAEYPLAVERLRNAFKAAEKLGLLGDNILGTGFNFHIRLSLGAGAFVCGEETSLLNSVQGGRGEPRTKPPYPTQSGLWEKPTNINNVETYANVCPIILRGSDWFSRIGTKESKGTKVFALAGKINNVGLAEVPMGISLMEIINQIGGGIKGGKKFKAVQTGGPAGGCIPSDMADMPIDYENLAEKGCMMGSGGMIVMDEDDCMVNIAKFYLEFTVDESCGRCTPCRIGNRRLHEILVRITEGNGKMEDLDELVKLGEVIKDCSLCGLGQAAPNPVLSTVNYFLDEYKAHIIDKKCPAGSCTHLMQYKVLAERCTGCTLCARNCPVPCIEGERKKPHGIIQEKCIKCGICYSKCPVKAIVRE